MGPTDRARTEVGRALAALPLPLRYSAVAAVALGLLGGVVGLVLGLVGYPATAWFAVLEVGVPGAALGAIAGLLAGSVVRLVRRGGPSGPSRSGQVPPDPAGGRRPGCVRPRGEDNCGGAAGSR